MKKCSWYDFSCNWCKKLHPAQIKKHIPPRLMGEGMGEGATSKELKTI